MHALLLATLLNSAAVDRAVRLVMRTQHVAGLSVGIARNGRPLYERGYGMRDLGRRLPARPETIYRIGSLTKTFTAAAVVRLASGARLSLTDPVRKYVPEFPWKQEVTIQELLEQRSGIPNYSGVATLDPHAEHTPAELLAAVASLPLEFPPGTQYAYSNTNYSLLGMAIERAGGTPYGTYLQTSILDPMALRQTRYGDAPQQARGYARDWLETPVRPTSVSYAFAAAGMTSNVTDLLHWLQHAAEPYYGMTSSDMYGHSVRYATGNVNGYSSFALVAPNDRDAVVILTNADRLDLFPLALSIFSALEQPAAQSYARGFGPPENEDPKITQRVRDIVAELASPAGADLPARDFERLHSEFASLGTAILFEFIGREPERSGAKYTYRVSFNSGARLLVGVSFAANGTVEAISVERP